MFAAVWTREVKVCEGSFSGMYRFGISWKSVKKDPEAWSPLIRICHDTNEGTAHDFAARKDI